MDDAAADQDVNKRVLMAVIHIIEAWMERDRGALARINGGASRPDSVLGEKSKRAYSVLKQYLPSHAHANLVAGIAGIAPRATAGVGETARRWARPEDRVRVARALLASAARAQSAAEEREERARIAAELEAARLAAEAERLAAEEARRAAEAESEARRRAERARVLARYRGEADAELRRDFLGADAWFDSWDTGGHVARSDFEDWKAAFVQNWAREVLHDDKFDIQQARAVSTTSHDLRLVARAGSGKTRTIVTRALFLQLHCRVDPGGILLVAFNRKAVEEISKRLGEALPKGARLPHVVTFHALAYALLRPEEELVFDDSESLAQSRKVQAVVNDLIVERKDDVRRAMLGHFTDDWKRIQQRGLHMSREEFFASRAEVTRVTLGGEYVKSFGERLIANTLFEHGVEYKYERNFTRGGFNYRPDFTVLVNWKPRVVIEYFGITDDPQYQRNADTKREFWAQQSDVVFLEYDPSQIVSLGEEGFRDQVLAALDHAEIPHRSLSEDEIWERVRQRAIDTFSKTLRGFVNRARQHNLSPDDIRQRMYALQDPGDGVVAFLELAGDVLEEYLNRARRDGFEDFSGVMWRAAAEVRRGRATWTRAGGKEHGDLRDLRFIHVDEFQDFSEMFMDFVQAIRVQAPGSSLCCVGDDWQAINGFAGADLRFFENFETDFPKAVTHQLVTNYRSGGRIVSAGNAVMDGFGEPARSFQSRSGSIHIARLTDFEPSPTERHVFQGDVGTPALLRLIKSGLNETEGTVAVLFRRNTVPWFTNTGQGAFVRKLDGYLTHLRGHFSEDDGKRLEVTTSHKYKGRESDFVIVADADKKSYPLIHPTVELFEVFGDTVDSLTDADRRLFYVATTRAESSLCYLVSSEDPSSFLGAVMAMARPVDWRALPIAVSDADAQVEVRVYDGFEVRQRLKDEFGFQFDESTKVWYVFRPADGFDFRHIQQVLSFVGPRLIEVRDETQRVIHRAGARLERGRPM
ncbi:DEAD/DEAH box helicase [Nocardioides panacisoli]|uniref:DEAD/DEAH box helicase n=1 Tax=Nocardioides panacisoli TaxID=627624 RepID=UPI001C629DDB|nr:DEAD/DEAH box helicase [Nocardioides panacisoli]QYJ04172.1 DEAD/DEAH box helicase [Nocardioides panacisoli]